MADEPPKPASKIAEATGVSAGVGSARGVGEEWHAVTRVAAPKSASGIEAQLRVLHLARGEAINAYAELEASLCKLFCFLSGTNERVGSVIFYKIVSTRARTSILTELMEQKYRGEWQPDFWTFIKQFWRTLISEVGKIDQTRNEIVHWHVGLDVYLLGNDQVRFRYDPTLYSPQRLPGGAVTKTIEEMDEFHVKCEFVDHSLIRLTLLLDGRKTFDELAPWREIFAQPLQYPPSSPHPLSPMLEVLRIRLAASRR